MSLCLCPAVRADNWQASIYEEGVPQHVVGVDKKNRTFNFFEKNSPLRLKYSYPCVTGQLQGDKQQINDLRTPEGIYFVEYKIANGLDFREYGGVAYTLNYPNPVDRLRGKTGHGIWIHSKGFELSPTRGCVAIDLRSISEVGPLLTPGTPVVVAEELKGTTADDDALATLRGLMAEWSQAWESRSDRLFNYYDPDSYTRATENFTAFRQNKERLFKILSFIKIYNREIHALEGPGYWVTWSEQYYTASNLSTEGIRRLYWQKNDQGQFRIVGMEWTPRDVGMSADFKKGRLVAQAQPVVVADTASELPLAPRLDMPEQPAADAPASPDKSYLGRIKGSIGATIAALTENLVAISEPLVRKKMPRAEPPEEFSWGIGRKLTEPQPPATPAQPATQTQPETPAPAAAQPAPATVQPASTPASKTNAQPVDLAHDGATEAEVLARENAWAQAYRNRSDDIEQLYNAARFNRLPQTYKLPHVQSLKTHLRLIKNELAQPWLFFVNRPATIDINGPLARSTTEEMVVTPQGIRQGRQRLWWQKDEAGDFKIVAADFQPASLGLEANYLEHITNDVSRMIEDWRRAWLSGNIDDYISFYATNASQQGRVGQANIRRQKEQLWSRVKPSQVQLSGLRLAMDGKGIRADMNQDYADSSGRADKGVKTLFLRYDGNRWLIQREDWADSRAQAGLNTIRTAKRLP